MFLSDLIAALEAVRATCGGDVPVVLRLAPYDDEVRFAVATETQPPVDGRRNELVILALPGALDDE